MNRMFVAAAMMNRIAVANVVALKTLAVSIVTLALIDRGRTGKTSVTMQKGLVRRGRSSEWKHEWKEVPHRNVPSA